MWWQITIGYFIIGFILAYFAHRKKWEATDEFNELEYFLLFVWPFVGIAMILFGLWIMGSNFIGGFHKLIQGMFGHIDILVIGIKRFIRKKKTPVMNYKYETYDE
jgi:hypothetical protein